jgi:hypothetical protein
VQVVAPVEVHVFAAGVEVTVYPVIAAPPFDTGAVQEMTEAVFRFEVASTAVGAPGTVDGTAAADAAEATEVPLGFVAVTVNVYEVPFVRPATVQEVAPVEVQTFEPGVDSTEYEVIALPPFETGAVQDTTD